MPISSTSLSEAAPQSRKIVSTVGALSCSTLRTWMAGQPNTARTGPFAVWMMTRLLGAMRASEPPLRRRYR